MTKFEADVAEDSAPDVVQGDDLDARQAPASLAPSRGHIASNGQSAAAASAVGGIRHRKAGNTVRTQDKVLLDAAIEVEKTRRLAPGDPGAATIVGRNIDTDALLKETLANTPGLERALALAQQLDAQLSGISADQELGLATARVAAERYGPEPTEPEPEAEDVEIDVDFSPELAGPEVASPEIADADSLPGVAGATPEGPATKRRVGALAGVLLAAAIAAALLLTGKCAVDSPDATEAAENSANPATGPSARSAANPPAANAPAHSLAPHTTSPELKATPSSSAAPTASASSLPEPSQSPSAISPPPPKAVRPRPRYRPPPRPGSKSSPFIIHPGGQK